MTDKSPFKRVVIWIVSFWIVVFVFFPNLLVLATSFLTRDEVELVIPTPSLSAYRDLFDPGFFIICVHSFFYAGGATLLCLLISYPFVFILSRSPYKKVLLLLVVIPFWTSSLIRTYSLIILIKANGLVNNWLMAWRIIDAPIEMMYTDGAVFLGLVYTLLPFMILPLYAVVEKLDTRLIEAGYDLGASRMQVFWHIIFPVTLPGIIAGGILVFLPALGLFYIPDLLGGAKSMLIGNFIKNQFLSSRNWPMGSAASILLTVLMSLLLAAYYKSLKRFNTHLIE